LVEANPIHKDGLKKMKNSFTVNAAICNTNTIVHFYNKGFESGIVEFMSEKTLQRHWVPKTSETITRRDLLKNQSVQVPCVPLAHIFEAAQINHIDYFILDVEGAEFEILKSINWYNIRFDVLTVETEEAFREVGYTKKLIAYLGERNYSYVKNFPGRNSWFIHQSFTPSSRPGIFQNCFSGALWGLIMRNENSTAQGYFGHCPPNFFNQKCQNCNMTTY
jgi:FkbM family methyltransferase